jgi:fluoroquinolone transport system ATP-binding protein
MNVADELCDCVGFLVDGRLTSVDAPAALRLRYGRRALRVQFQSDGVSQAEEFPLDGLADNAAFQARLRERHVESMHSQEPTLEDVFLQVTGRALE